MTLFDFDEEIDDIIIERGEDYYYGGAVKNVSRLNKDRWVINVEGTELYRVEITLEGDEIIESYCN